MPFHRLGGERTAAARTTEKKNCQNLQLQTFSMAEDAGQDAGRSWIGWGKKMRVEEMQPQTGKVVIITGGRRHCQPCGMIANIYIYKAVEEPGSQCQNGRTNCCSSRDTWTISKGLSSLVSSVVAAV